jgi:hypothetical protein
MSWNMIELGACQDRRLGLMIRFRPQHYKWRVRMAKVMIKCPDTGKLVFTGVFGDKALLEGLQIAGKSTFGRKSKPFCRNSGSLKAIRVAFGGGPAFEVETAIDPVFGQGA